MNKGLEALKRIRQETCPATYMPDFDKEECCKIIEKELKALEILKNIGIIRPYQSIFGPCWLESMYGTFKISEEDYALFKEILL